MPRLPVPSDTFINIYYCKNTLSGWGTNKKDAYIYNIIVNKPFMYYKYKNISLW